MSQKVYPITTNPTDYLAIVHDENILLGHDLDGPIYVFRDKNMIFISLNKYGDPPNITFKEKYFRYMNEELDGENITEEAIRKIVKMSDLKHTPTL